MQELTFGRLSTYPKAITPEIEAKREKVRDVFRATLTPAYVHIYNEGVVPCSDEEILATSRGSAELISKRNPEVPLLAIKNAIVLAQQEWEIRKLFPAV